MFGKMLCKENAQQAEEMGHEFFQNDSCNLLEIWVCVFSKIEGPPKRDQCFALNASYFEVFEGSFGSTHPSCRGVPPSPKDRED